MPDTVPAIFKPSIRRARSATAAVARPSRRFLDAVPGVSVSTLGSLSVGNKTVALRASHGRRRQDAARALRAASAGGREVRGPGARHRGAVLTEGGVMRTLRAATNGGQLATARGSWQN